MRFQQLFFYRFSKIFTHLRHLYDILEKIRMLQRRLYSTFSHDQEQTKWVE